MALFDIFLFDVLLASVHLYSDISLAYTYFDTDNPWWAGVTLFAIALPGILGTIKRETTNRNILHFHISYKLMSSHHRVSDLLDPILGWWIDGGKVRTNTAVTYLGCSFWSSVLSSVVDNLAHFSNVERRNGLYGISKHCKVYNYQILR